MDIDTAKIRDLLNRRDEIDKELADMLTGSTSKKAINCGMCGQQGHSDRTCPSKPQP